MNIFFKRTKFTKSEIHLILFEKNQYGSVGDIITMNRREARQLIQSRQGYYVPRYKNQPILPMNYQPPVKNIELELESITPFQSLVPLVHDTTTPKNVLETISLFDPNSVEPLLFKRVLIHKDTNSIFGSVSGTDVQTELQNKYGIQVPVIECRFKTVGTHEITFEYQGNKIPCTIIIEPQLS